MGARKVWPGVCLVAAGLLAAPAAADAHHSFAMFDHARKITLSGTVKDWQWVNPHTWLQLTVPAADGAGVEWRIEGRSPNVLSRRGWTRKVLAPGDKVTVVIYPLKSGEPGGAFVRLKLANGTELNADTPTAVDPDEEGPRQ